MIEFDTDRKQANPDSNMKTARSEQTERAVDVIS